MRTFLVVLQKEISDWCQPFILSYFPENCIKMKKTGLGAHPKVLPAANEVWGKVMFLFLSVCSQGEAGLPDLSVGRHGGLNNTPGCRFPRCRPPLDAASPWILDADSIDADPPARNTVNK